MLSACNVSTIVVCLCSIEPLARNSLLCSSAFMEAAKKVVAVMETKRKVVDKPKELTSTNDAHNLDEPKALWRANTRVDLSLCVDH